MEKLATKGFTIANCVEKYTYKKLYICFNSVQARNAMAMALHVPNASQMPTRIGGGNRTITDAT